MDAQRTNHIAGEDVTLRILFVADTADEARVRQLIEDALSSPLI